MPQPFVKSLLAAVVLVPLAAPAEAADAPIGASMPLALAVPFAALLISVALGPLLAPRLWHRNYGGIALFWALATLVPLALFYGTQSAAEVAFHTVATDYVPFIFMLFALFTTAGGVALHGKLPGKPTVNTAVLALGALLASLIGTTGASMILIRPLLRANQHRAANAHLPIFFIFLVANIGGALTPLGDPPLFLGFLSGVRFFWTTQNLWPQTLTAVVCLLALFFAIDTFLLRRERGIPHDPVALLETEEKLHVSGLVNLPLIALVIGAILMSGVWHPGSGIILFGTRFETQNLLREAIMLAVGLLSIVLTKKATREANGFEWEPLVEVAKIFAAIFVCITPVIVMLQAGRDGPFAPLIDLLGHADGSPNNLAYFWLTGGLSSFLDNAPTYLVFFEIAGGDAAQLMENLAKTLAAISLGAVFMGANTYLGNAPNFMVYAIARRAGVAMPSFFGYMAWSCAILLPLFALISWVFFR